jgi:cytochrome c
MSFAGLSNPQDRADVIAFLNQHSDAPKPLPAAPAAQTAASGAKPGNGPDNGPQKADKEPVPATGTVGKTPQTSGGDAGGKPKP